MTTRSPQRGSPNSELPDDDADVLGPVGVLGSTRSGAGRDEVGDGVDDSDSDLLDGGDLDLIGPSRDAIGDSLPETDDDVVPEESLAHSESEPEPEPEVRSQKPKAGASTTGTSSRMPIFDPLHNIRECSKQLVLLEDHLEHPPKHCPDCIRKHLLTAEAFAEEAVSLDKVGRYQDVLGLIPDRVRALAGAYVAATPEQRHVVAQKVRVLRKELSKLGFDALPDGTDGSARAASGVGMGKKREEVAGDAGDPSAMGGAEGAASGASGAKGARKASLGRVVMLVRDALAGEPGVFGVSPGSDCVVVRATPATAARLPSEVLGWPIRAVSGDVATRTGSRSGGGSVRPGSWLNGNAATGKPTKKAQGKGSASRGEGPTSARESTGAASVSTSAEENATPATDAAVPPPRAEAPGGWHAWSDVIFDRMTAEQHAFMDRLRAALPLYIPLTVSSSFRTPEEQANAMRNKLAEGATLDDLRRLYGNGAAINEVLRFPASRWGGVISSQVARGVYLSRHLRHGALDLSVKLPEDGSYMARAWQDAIVAAAQAAGAGRAFIEPDPLHVHIERIGVPGEPGAADSGTAVAQTEESSGSEIVSWLPWILAGAGVLAVVGFGWLGGAALLGAGAAGAAGMFGFGSDDSSGRSR